MHVMSQMPRHHTVGVSGLPQICILRVCPVKLFPFGDGEYIMTAVLKIYYSVQEFSRMLNVYSLLGGCGGGEFCETGYSVAGLFSAFNMLMCTLNLSKGIPHVMAEIKKDSSR